MKEGDLVVFSEPRKGCKKPEPEVVAEVLACYGGGPYRLAEDLKPCTCGRKAQSRPCHEDCPSLYTEIRVGDGERKYSVRMQDLMPAPVPDQVPVLS